MRHRMWQGMAAAACVAAAAGSASATVVIGNLPAANDGTSSALLNNLRIKALSFTMPAGPGYFLDNVVVRLRNYEAGEAVFVQIRADDGTGNPGATVLADLVVPTGVGAAATDYTTTPSGSVSLLGGATYWVYVAGSATSSFDWTASSPGIPPTGVATFGLNRFTTNGGSTWTNSTIINSFQVNGTLIPTPGTLAVLAGLGLVAGRRRR